MSQIELTLEKFFSKNPDIREARSKGLINRRALARYIADKENIPSKNFDALAILVRTYKVHRIHRTFQKYEYKCKRPCCNSMSKKFRKSTKHNTASVSVTWPNT